MLTCRDLVARSSGFLDGHLRLRERLGVRRVRLEVLDVRALPVLAEERLLYLLLG